MEKFNKICRDLIKLERFNKIGKFINSGLP